MATMSMNKVIHGAVRRDLERFVAALRSFSDGDRERAEGLGRAWDNLDAELTRHHQGEHEIAWPHLERAGVSRTVLDQMDGEHQVMVDALVHVRAAMAALGGEPTSARAQEALTAMAALRTATLSHLEHEEAELEPFYLTNKDHPEIRAMNRAFSRQSPAVAGRFFAWVSDGISPEARESVEVPGPVLAVLSGLFGRGYRKDVAPVWQ
jgi:hypothetical protein